jgi:hypothetical protein
MPAFRRPWRPDLAPLAVLGIWNARKASQRKRSAGWPSGWTGVDDKRRNTREWGCDGWPSCPFRAFGPCCYACCYSRGSRPVISVSRPVYVAIIPPEIQETPKARGERALWRVLTRADLSSQIEAPVGVEPTMADLQSAIGFVHFFAVSGGDNSSTAGMASMDRADARTCAVIRVPH